MLTPLHRMDVNSRVIDLSSCKLESVLSWSGLAEDSSFAVVRATDSQLPIR